MAVFWMVKLAINGLEMRKEKQEFLERTEKDNNNEQEPQLDVQEEDFFKDEFDEEFWIKVITSYLFHLKF